MYYVWSLISTIIIFFILQLNEYNKQKIPNNYNLYTFSNLSTFIVIYLILTIISYFLFEIDYNSLNKIDYKKVTGGNDINIDPVMLRKISEPMYTGFYPHNSDL